MSVYDGKDGYDSARLWNERSKQALKERGGLYHYDTRLESSDQILLWLRGQFVELGYFPHVLEIGAGFGRWAEAFKNEYASFTGVDIVPERVEHARELRRKISNASFELISGPAWNLGRLFDVVLSITVIQHLCVPEAITVLQGIERHLAPGGVAFLAEWSLSDITVREAEELYRKRTTPAHMVSKPLCVLKEAAPGLEWSGTTGRFILRRRK